MTTTIGVWIDHWHAAVARVAPDRAQCLRLDRKQDAVAEGDANPRPYTPNDFVPEDRLERRDAARLKSFFDDVIVLLHDADSVVAFGPGEAKGKFLRRLKRRLPQLRVAHVGTVDKMTDAEVVAYVRDHVDGHVAPANRSATQIRTGERR